MDKYPILTKVAALSEYRLMLTYSNNERRLYNFAPNLEHKFYRPLSNPALFKRALVVDGDLHWPTGQDFCPHTLYEKSVLVDT